MGVTGSEKGLRSQVSVQHAQLLHGASHRRRGAVAHRDRGEQRGPAPSIQGGAKGSRSIAWTTVSIFKHCFGTVIFQHTVSPAVNHAQITEMERVAGVGRLEHSGGCRNASHQGMPQVGRERHRRRAQLAAARAVVLGTQRDSGGEEGRNGLRQVEALRRGLRPANLLSERQRALLVTIYRGSAALI